MTSITKLILSGFIITLWSCNWQKPGSAVDKIPLIPKDTSNKNERENRLFVFVGEKISITPIPRSQGDFDSGVKAKYLVLQRVYGYYEKDTIEFEAYDHFGRFGFADYKNVLLYISEYEGRLIQEKYMYDPLYKTKDGRWASFYSDDYGHVNNEHTTVKPERIEFAEEVSFSVKALNENGKEILLTYQEPYFKIVGDKAVAVYGNYVPELFRLKREGVLTARELFGDKKPEVMEMTIQDVTDTSHKN